MPPAACRAFVWFSYRKASVQSDLTKTLLRLMFAGPEAGGPASLSPQLMQSLLLDLCRVPDAVSLAKVLALGIDVGKMPAHVQSYLLRKSLQHETTEAVHLLLDHGADPYVYGRDGGVLLDAVMSPRAAAFLPMLLARGPAPYLSTSRAFAEACRRVDMSSVNLLLPIDVKTNKDRIGLAARGGFQDVLQLLVKQPYTVQKDVDFGLAWAVHSGQFQAAEWLLQQGALPDRDGSITVAIGSDAALYAADGARLAMVRLLLRHGAHVTNAVMEMAEASGMQNVIELLRGQEIWDVVGWE